MYEMQKKIRLSSLKISIVVTLALVILFMAIFFAGNISNLFTLKIKLFAQIPDVQGLRNGAPVWLYGVEIGNVQNIELSSNGALISISINNKYQKDIHKNAEIQIMTMGILGDKFVKISSGTQTAAFVNEGDTLSGKSSVSFDELTSNAQVMMAGLDSAISKLIYLTVQINGTSGSLGKLINEPELYNNLVSATSRLNFMIRDINTSNGSVKQFLNDTTLYNVVYNMALNLSTVASILDSSFENGSMASALLNDTLIANDLKLIFGNIRSATNNLNKLIDDIKTNPNKYFKVELF